MSFIYFYANLNRGNFPYYYMIFIGVLPRMIIFCTRI